MKFKLFLFVAIAFIAFGVPAIGQAQTVIQETIVSFIADISVNPDNSVDVTESIIYNSGSSDRHGIYRDISPYSSQGLLMSIDDISVQDESGKAYQFERLKSGNNVRIKIGDPYQTFSGQKTYILKYHATKAVSQFKKLDEIYWNVTGNEWTMPILEVKATVSLPSLPEQIQSACYFGREGSKNKCEANANELLFQSTSSLEAYEGMTIAVGFPKGIVSPYSFLDRLLNLLVIYWRWLVASLLPLLTFIFSLRHWFKYGRDARGTGVIVPQYEVPDGLSPMEVGGIVNERVVRSDVSAQIIYLATKGYIKIKELGERTVGLVKVADYELQMSKDLGDLVNDFDKKLMEGIFNNSELTASMDEDEESPSTSSDELVNSIKISDLVFRFHWRASTVVDSVLNALVRKGYYKNLGRMKSDGRIFILIFMSIWASGFIGGMLGLIFFGGYPFPLIVGIFLSIVIYGIISHFYPAKTQKGADMKDYLKGLKIYLEIAEKDRLEFHNAPEKKPELFEKLLPYAMVMGVARIWAKEFEDIYTAPPSWYSGKSITGFNATSFSDNLSSFSSSISNGFSSSGSGGRSGMGSGGGGSSGGGGGGGGGGSW